MSAIAALRDEIHRSVHGGAWHGPALLEAVVDLGAGEAAARPIPGGRSAWEVVLHCAGWMREVVRRLGAEPAALPPGGDWPAPPPPDERAWEEARAELERAAAELDAALAAFPVDRLGDLVPYAQERLEPGYDPTFELTLHGVAQHNAYHAGQLMLLKRAARAATAAVAIPSLPT